MELKFSPDISKIFVTTLINVSFLWGLPIIIGSYFLYSINNLFGIILFSVGLLVYLFILIYGVGSAKNTIYTVNDTMLSKEKTFISHMEEDVPVCEVTNIDYIRSWLWDKIFNTGSINIYTAGSGSIDIRFGNIKNTVDVYDKINSYVQVYKNSNKVINSDDVNNENNVDNTVGINNINNNESKLIERVKPNTFIALLSKLVSFVVGMFIMLIYAIGFIVDGDISLQLLGLGAVILLMFNIGSMYFVYLTYKKKYYDFYTDKLEYYDGFLTFHKATVPLDRITDITETRTLLEKIFGVSKIKIETAGSSGAEIAITFVSNGDKIVQRLKEVLKENGRN